MMERNIRMRGMLYHQQQRFGKISERQKMIIVLMTDFWRFYFAFAFNQQHLTPRVSVEASVNILKWKKVWAEAVAQSTHSLSCLELFEFKKSSMKESKKCAEGGKLIVLRDCVKITEGKIEGCPTECSSFLLETTEKTHIFASPTSELHSWITELCKLAFPMNQTDYKSQKQDNHNQAIHMEENTLYGTTENVQDFPVIAVASEAALRCKLYGEYILTPRSDSLLLRDGKTKQVLLTWPYRFVRKFGQDMLSFNFEAGRRCESGEGFFEFAMSQSEQLFTIINDALKNYPKVETNRTRQKEQHTLQPQQSFTPPAQEKHPKKKLTSSFSLNTNNLSDVSKKVNISSTPSLPSNTQDPVYALINRPKLRLKNKCKKQQDDPDFESYAENIFGALDEEEKGDQMNLQELHFHSKCEDFAVEPVYSEVNTYQDYTSNYEAVNHEPRSLTFDLNDSQAAGFNKDPFNFQPLSERISRVGYEERQLDLSVEQLSIHNTPTVYEADSVYSQIPNYYDGYDW